MHALFALKHVHDVFSFRPRLFEHFPPPRYSVSRSGNNPGRVKRVVSCKRKTHHLTVARRKQLGSGRVFDAVNKENEMNRLQDTQQEMFDMDPLEFSLNVHNSHKAGRTGSKQTDFSTLTEVRNTITVQILILFTIDDVLLGMTVFLICIISLNQSMFFSSQRIMAR